MEDDQLRKFWEIEDYYFKKPVLSLEERTVVEHFSVSHFKHDSGRFVVPLPRKKGIIALGESRAQALERLYRMEHSLRRKGAFQEFADVIREYFELGHAEPVPIKELDRQCTEVYYFQMHAVRKETTSTRKIRVVFDASAKSTSGASLNDHLMVGPTVYSSLVDVLIRFRQHKVALTTDVSSMYRAVLLHKGAKRPPPFPVEGGPISVGKGLQDD